MDLDCLPLQDLLRKRRALVRQLGASDLLQPIRIAVLGGSTTNEVVDLLELYLLASGFKPTFHQCEYGQYYEEAVHNTAVLQSFAPDIVYIHISWKNVLVTLMLSATEEDLNSAVAAEVSRYREMWSSLDAAVGCQIIQNNFELPPYPMLGNLDAVLPGSSIQISLALNSAFAREAALRPRLVLQDVNILSAQLGLAQWFDWDRWFSYKVLLTPEAHVLVARSLVSIVKALYGRSRKVLVLDLDNTLWGGVIGDDGVDRIQIGRETPMAEAFTSFQEYCVKLREQGVLLAVCSKNDDEVARSGFFHADSTLKLEHISAFRANWQPKHENIQSIAEELNLGVDSFVFADDNPAERAIVAAQIPAIAVPDLGNNPANYAAVLQAGRYFESVAVSKEDLDRASLYANNAQRSASQAAFANYGEYLDSLEMSSEIALFSGIYLDRIAQLTNKTNQFNLTTRRYTLAEMEAVAADPKYVGLYGRLRDRFGDNGLVSVILGRREGEQLHLDLWLMSCRVLKRDMEFAMLDQLVSKARSMGISSLVGVYLPTKKNRMVQDLYDRLGFTPTEATAEAVCYILNVENYRDQNKHIRLEGNRNEQHRHSGPTAADLSGHSGSA